MGALRLRMTHLSPIDWIILLGLMAGFVIIGVRFRNRGASSLSDFFLGGRNLPWYVAGVSMVATTFAADTPLWVTEKIAQHGISGNWLWWNMVIGGMLTTFFFARLWRRARIITELEFLELRYSGPVARWLRGIKAVYLGLFLNVIIIGWVNAALISILEVFFSIPYTTAFWATMAAMALVALYSSVAGLLGIAITDFVQFIIAMTGSIILAILVVQAPEVGGLSGLQEKLPAWRLQFFPRLGGWGDVASGTFALSAGAFFSYLGVQWWASWYPGAEPGGGGYISQRMMSTRSEKDAVLSSLFFQIAHYCLRPWPWIIVGLAALILYPDLPLEDSRKGFIMAMRDHLPAGLRGLLLAGFFSAYMSTLSTQLNWGSSYLTNDLYQRFIRPRDGFATPQKAQDHYVRAGRLITVMIMIVALLVTTQITTIDAAAKFLLSSGAGLGMVLILRWYWWRINAWTELTATLAPILGLSLARTLLPRYLPDAFFAQNGEFLFTVAFTTVAWLTVTFLTRPTDAAVLARFYRRIRPGGFWGPAAKSASSLPQQPLRYQLLAWLAGVVLVYALLFSVGYGLFGQYRALLLCLLALIPAIALLRWAMYRAGYLEETSDDANNF